MRFIEALVKGCAIFAGLLMIGVSLLTCVSVVGRNAFGWGLDGDFELVGFASGAALALCLPWCQFERGNIIVDFFTANASEKVRSGLDRIGSAVLASAMAALAWRSLEGGINAWRSQSSSMVLGVPEWAVYAFIVPGLALAAVVATVQAVYGFPATEPDSPEVSA